MKQVLVLLLLVGWQHFAAGLATCQMDHSPCHRDCCINGLQFCSERERRCRTCAVFENMCGKPGVDPACLLFCHKILLNTTTTALPTSSTDSSSSEGGDVDHNSFNAAVLTPEILTAIAVPCTLLLALVAVCVLVVCLLRKQRAWLGNNTPRWLRTLFSKNSREQVSQRGVTTLNDTEGNHVDKTSGEVPLMDRGEGDADEQTAVNADEDGALLNLDQRSSNPSLVPSGGQGAKEVTAPVNEQPDIAEAIPQQREDYSPAGRRDDGGGASSSAGSSPPSTGERSGHRPQGGTPHSPHGPRDSPPQRFDHHLNPETADSHARSHRDARGSTQHIIQSNDNRTSIHIYTQGGGLPDYHVSRPAGPQPQPQPAHNGESGPGGASNATQGPCNDPRLYTTPSNPDNHDHNMRVEVAPGVENPTRQYPHLQNGQNFGPVQ